MRMCDREKQHRNLENGNGTGCASQKTGWGRVKRAALTFLLFSMAALTACAPAETPKPQEKTVLQLWHYWNRGDSRQCLAKLIREFNETHEDIEIQANYIADEDFKKRLVLAASEGEQPDLAIVDSSDIQCYDKSGSGDLSTEIREEDYLSRALISCRTRMGGS